MPKWNLYNDSRLSVRSNDVEFFRHAFPPTAVSNMEIMVNVAISHNMPYAIA